MAGESISIELSSLSRHVTDIIGFRQQRTAQNDVVQFRLNWLRNGVVRYCDNIPSREAVLALVQEVKVLLRQNAKCFLLLPKLGEICFVIKANFSSAQTSLPVL